MLKKILLPAVVALHIGAMGVAPAIAGETMETKLSMFTECMVAAGFTADDHYQIRVEKEQVGNEEIIKSFKIRYADRVLAHDALRGKVDGCKALL